MLCAKEHSERLENFGIFAVQSSNKWYKTEGFTKGDGAKGYPPSSYTLYVSLGNFIIIIIINQSVFNGNLKLCVS